MIQACQETFPSQEVRNSSKLCLHLARLYAENADNSHPADCLVLFWKVKLGWHIDQRYNIENLALLAWLAWQAECNKLLWGSQINLTVFWLVAFCRNQRTSECKQWLPSWLFPTLERWGIWTLLHNIVCYCKDRQAWLQTTICIVFNMICKKSLSLSLQAYLESKVIRNASKEVAYKRQEAWRDIIAVFAGSFAEACLRGLCGRDAKNIQGSAADNFTAPLPQWHSPAGEWASLPRSSRLLQWAGGDCRPQQNQEF